MKLKNKVILITGSSSGIGEAFLYLAKNDSVTGEILIVDGGYTTNL